MDVISAWRLAYLYPEVCRAHADFGGCLEDMLREYHRQVIAERETRPETENPQSGDTEAKHNVV
jgi:hypothetical protein